MGQAQTIKKGPNKGKPRFPNDRAAGVGILLSWRMQLKVLSFGSESERCCWVRLRGPVCNLFVIATYISHRGRVSPAQGDTLADVQKVLSKVPPRDCVCLLGDINEQLESNAQGATGPYTGGPPNHQLYHLRTLQTDRYGQSQRISQANTLPSIRPSPRSRRGPRSKATTNYHYSPGTNQRPRGFYSRTPPPPFPPFS